MASKFAEYAKRWRGKNREKYNAYQREYRKQRLDDIRTGDVVRYQRAKVDVVLAYGGECACCGEWRMALLTIDHHRDDYKGIRHPRAGGNGKTVLAHMRGHGEYARLKKMGFPAGLVRVLCMNCNWATRRGDACPHEVERSRFVSPEGKEYRG